MALFGFEQPLGWLAFLSFIPLILLYIVRPKEKEIEVPSLMFFMKSKTSHAKQSFFQKLVKNWLFLLQLLILLLLSLYLLEPYTTLGGSILTENAILLVDTSASTQAHNNEVFEAIITEAKENLGKTNTIIIISNTPRTVLKKATKREATKYLNKLKPTDSRSSIGEAINLAEKHVTGKKDKIIVLSDFLSTSTVNVQTAKKTLEDKGITVLFRPIILEEVKNIGIVGLDVSKEKTIISVKNYNNEAQKATLIIGNKEKKLVIDAKSTQTTTIETPQKPTTLTLIEKDDFLPDNEAYITFPQVKKVKVLLISDSPSTYLQTALTAATNIQLDVTGSSSYISGYDIYIIGAVRELRTSLTNKLQESVEQGASVIIYMQENSAAINYGKLLPFTLGGIRGESVVTIEHLTKFTKDITFGSVKRYYATTTLEGISIAKAEEGVIVTLTPQGQGNIVYYGILEDQSDFKFSPSYPIFWTNLIKYLAQATDINDVNIPTGTIISLPTKKEISTPSRTITTDIIIFEEKGIYKSEDQIYAASLMSELESNLNAKTALTKNTEKKTTTAALRYSLTTPIILLLFLLLFIELLTTKSRGEI